MELFKFFDAYSVRARLFPAIIAAAPALTAFALLISWKSFGLSNLVATLGMLVLLFAIADFSRARGRAIEGKLYTEHGGMPSISMFRRNDETIDGGSKERYRNFLASELALTAPSPSDESADPGAADAFYSQCGNWLRQNTRDMKKFPILFGENITYGFRRNLLGAKAFALSLNAIVVAICIFVLWRLSWNIQTPLGGRIVAIFVIAAGHAGYMLLAVNRTAVWDASQVYGRELILSCESFLAHSKSLGRNAATRKSTSKEKSTNLPPEQS